MFLLSMVLLVAGANAAHVKGRLQREEAQTLHEQYLEQFEQKLMRAAETLGVEAEVTEYLREKVPVAAKTQRDLYLRLRKQALNDVEDDLEDKAESYKLDTEIHRILRQNNLGPYRPLPEGWKKVTKLNLISGRERVYYTNRKSPGDIGLVRSVKPRAAAIWDPQYLSMADRDQDAQVAKARQAVGRQCQKCSLLYTDQEMREHVQAATSPHNLTDQQLAKIIEAGGAVLKTCTSCIMKMGASQILARDGLNTVRAMFHGLKQPPQ